MLQSACFFINRLEEYDNIGSKHQRLKAAAHELDRRLRGEHADGSRDPRFRTLVHGDFKSANLLFSARAPVSCAAFDFQYCGEGGSFVGFGHRCSCHLRSCLPSTCCREAMSCDVQPESSQDLGQDISFGPSLAFTGYGARDVAKLLACSVQRRVLAQHEASLLHHYHSALVERLSAEQAAAYTFNIFMDHFELSVADFVRFMAGWGFWGETAWADRKTEAVLDMLAPDI